MEFFIEGTRSRSGRMLRPQHGLLDVARSLPLGPDARPLTVVPVFFSYEALVEGDAYIRQLSGESKKRESFLSALQTIRFLQLYLGSVRFRFGPPLTISPPDERIAEQSTAELSEKITARINDSAVFNPIHLCALAITDSHPGLIHESEIEDRIEFCKTLLRIDVHQHDYEIVSDTAEHCLSRAVSLGYFTREHDALFVDDQGVGHGTEFKEALPVTAGTGQPRGFYAQDRARPRPTSAMSDSTPSRATREAPARPGS